MKNRPYFTRKNLIIIALSIFYAVAIVFTAACIDGNFMFMHRSNPINLIAQSLNFTSIKAGVSGYVCVILVAIYVIVVTTAIIYEYRLAMFLNKKPYNWKMILSYLATIIVCLILSVGIGLVIQTPLSKENLLNVLTFIGQSVLLATMIYVALFAAIGSVAMLVVNFLLVDKPFKFFKKNEVPEEIFEDDEASGLIDSFDAEANINGNVSANALASGASNVVSSNSDNVSVAESLDDREKVFPTLSGIDVKYGGFDIESVESDDITLEQLCVKFRNYLAKDEGLYFDIDTIRVFISGFAASHFMILEGLSGTGKSSLPRYFAKFINANVLFVPVQATWRDKTNILGYFNDFSKIYSETDFLARLYESNYNPDQINIFVLDEMNISRVEYYFADFLSVLEFPEDQWKLKVMQLPYNFIPPAKLYDGYISILNNAYFVGTANKDDSTFVITDKVYDRSITIDFDNRNTPFAVNEDTSTIKLSKSKLHSLYKQALEVKENLMSKDDFDKFETITNYIYETFDLTFGNRILTQIDTLVPVFIACGGSKEDALDFLLSRKVLVKLEGRFEDYVKNALKRLLALIEKTYGAGVFKKSEKEIKNLIKKL